MSVRTPGPFRAVAVALALALGLLSACGPSVTAQQLTWCAENQAQVGRVALEEGLIGDPLDFTTWKENNPNDYERACALAFDRA